MEATTDLFINIIQNHQLIYDTASKDFKNVNKKEDEWEKIAKESRMSVDGAKKRYFSLRQKYSREKKKETICVRTKQTFRPWVFFERLSFLGDFIRPRRTYTSDIDGIDEDDLLNGDNSNDEATKPIQDKNFHQSSDKRLRLNDLSDDEYNHAMLFGEPMSLADEEAIMAEGLVFENSQDDSANFEVLAEIELGQQQVPVLLTDESSGSQEQALDIDARTSSMLGPLDIDAHASSVLSPHDEALRERAALSMEEQLAYVEIPSSEKGLCPLGSETFRVPSTAAHNANVERVSSSSVYVRSANSHHTSATSTQYTEGSSQAGTSNTRYRLIGSTQPETPKTTPHRNVPTANRKMPNSSLSKNSPVVQAIVAVRQQEKNPSSDKDAISMDKIKEKMESYLNACNDKLVKKPERPPHASFLSYLGSKMAGIPKEKIPSLEKEILDIVYRFSSEA